jgi:uncharacterized membrane protein
MNRGDMRVNIGRVERWLSMVAGGALAAYGLKRREAPGGAAAIAGAALLYRGATGHCDLYQALGVNRAYGRVNGNAFRGDGTGWIADRGSDTRAQLGGHRGIHVQESVTIDRPISELYRFWRNFENLPRFMEIWNRWRCVKKASHIGSRRVGRMRPEWTRIINEVENKVIGWQSPRGSMIRRQAPSTSTRYPGARVTVHLQQNARRAGAAVARIR